MTTIDEEPLSEDDRHHILAVARDAGADLSTARRLLLGHRRVRAFTLPDREFTQFEGVVIGLFECPALVIDTPTGQRAWASHLVEDLGPAHTPAPAARRAESRRGPSPDDQATARALHSLRPAALPWPALASAARLNLSIDAMPLRRALIAEGWIPPTNAQETR